MGTRVNWSEGSPTAYDPRQVSLLCGTCGGSRMWFGGRWSRHGRECPTCDGSGLSKEARRKAT